MKKLSYVLKTAIFLLATVSPQIMAVQTGDTVTYAFSGTFVLLTPCTVNGDQVLNIPFGNVGVKKVDGVQYTRPIPYEVDCHGAPDNSPLNLTISGNATSYDPAAVSTSAEGLGIQIQANGQPFTLNKSMRTTLGALSSLQLTAVPVKDPGKELAEQAFTAVATLTADYE